MSDPIRRALRTALQTFVAAFSISLLGFINDVQAWASDKGAFPAVDTLGKALMASLVAAVAGLVSFGVNALEDNTPMPALLKAPPSPGVNPVPDPAPDAGLSDFVVVAVIACVALLLVVLLITGTITPR